MRTLNFYPGRGLPGTFHRLALPPPLSGLMGASGKRRATVGPESKADASTWKTLDLTAPFWMLERMLSSKVTLQREGNSLHFSLIGEASEAPPPRPIDEALTDAQHLSPALKTLLDCHPKMRSAERHLAYAEGALATLGTKDMAEVPIEVLTIAVGQLELLVNNWSNRALAELRSMMAVAIGDRSRDAISAQDKLSNFFTESRLAVGDASQSMFMDLERQYQQALPAPSIQAALDSVKSSPPRRPSLHVSDQPERGQFQ